MADSGLVGGVAVAAPGAEGGPSPRVYFKSPARVEDEGQVRRQGKVTVKYDRKELRKRLNLEEWILEQLTSLYDYQEEEIPELEIDVDELLDMESDSTRAARIKELLADCYKPTETFISDLLDKIRGMQKLSTPQKKQDPTPTLTPSTGGRCGLATRTIATHPTPPRPCRNSNT
ncbi:protein phosphatase 1 regulatory subunit 14B-like [Dromiciops gliroides]|uniref:protein phosphatase 1 regulatory subunit 14B-like n=1 Tax=Dromiciops gliroides TaxID=33562 RepID=UPI001CC68D02|nr:protein phosphatase 1 regulatory subunit 14B-like [Dromiciops gliroides]